MASRGAVWVCRGTKAPVLPSCGLPMGAGLKGQALAPHRVTMACQWEGAEGHALAPLFWSLCSVAAYGSGPKWPGPSATLVEHMGAGLKGQAQPTRPKCQRDRAMGGGF